MPNKSNIPQKNSHINTPALFFMPEDNIERIHLDIVKNNVKATDNEQLFLVIKSYGGDAYSAVRIIKNLRTKYKTIVGVVPEYSYSAATLMLLGVNKILIAPEANIGPIDKPLEHSSSGESISALDVTQSISNLSSLVSENANAFYKEMRGYNATFPENISKKDALEIAWDSAIKLICPLIEKIDPILLQKSYRDLRIGMYYGLDLLYESMIKNKFKAFEIVRKLVNVYPSHGYAIFREEMKNLGLIVGDYEKDKDFEKLEQMYKTISSGIIFKEDIYV